MNRATPRLLPSLAALLLLPLITITGCPFTADTFQRRCFLPADCDDGLECTADLCTQGLCDNPFEPKKTKCGSDGKSVCDGAGECVDCLSSSDCAAKDPAVPICQLSTRTCVSCNDGKKNGEETEVDCGGPDCGACLGHACDPEHGCGNGAFCVQPENICCDKACDARCEACVFDKTGAPDGQCAPVPYGEDPDQECSTLGACGAAAGKCRCEDGVKNADESDVDCGGTTCQRCGGGKMCLNTTDCAADVAECVEGACCNSICELPCNACNPFGQCVNVPAGTEDPFCALPQVCGPNAAGCVGKAGTTCSSPSKCLSGVCTAGTCAKSAFGKPCNTTSDCAAGTCTAFVCQ